MLKFAIKISSPIRLERIRNGEKVIVQTGPTEYEVEVSEDEPEKFQSQGSQTARAKNHWAEALHVLEQGLKSAKRTGARRQPARGADGSKKPPL